MAEFTPKENYGHCKRNMDCLDNFDFNFDENLEECRNPSSEKIRNDPTECFPPKAISPLNQYPQQRLPTELVSASFSAYVANILNPSHMYIQLGDEEQALSDMNHAVEKFYSGPESRIFAMKNVHVLPGAIAVAQWPVDMHWYRIKVMSLMSDDSVKVFFIDYGTVDIILKSLLRYVREDFFDFPAQAMRASLAYLRPPRGFKTWHQRATDRILELTLDESVKTKVEDIKNDVLSVLLYNKNGIYINGVLVNEHLSQPTSVDINNPSPVNLSNISFSESNNSLCEFPCETSPSDKAKQPLTSMSQVSKSSCEKISDCVDFSKPLEIASTSAIAPVTCPKPKMTETELCLPKSSSLPIGVATNFNSSSSSNNSEIFDDDDDAYFEEFYQKVSLVSKRYVKRIKSNDGYIFHILIHNSKPYVSFGDISHLIWRNQDSEFLQQRLQNRESLLASVLIWEDENVEMFNQLKRFHVKGLKVVNDRTCLLIFCLNDLNEILNIFGHPSIELRKKINHEYSAFDLNNSVWKEVSEVEFTDEEEEEIFDRTYEDTLNRLCIYDLQVMKENICIRLQRLQQSDNPESEYSEEQKLRLLFEKVVQRMQEIRQICCDFTNT